MTMAMNLIQSTSCSKQYSGDVTHKHSFIKNSKLIQHQRRLTTRPSPSSSSLFSLPNLSLLFVAVGSLATISYVHHSQTVNRTQMHRAVIQDKQRLKEKQREFNNNSNSNKQQ